MMSKPRTASATVANLAQVEARSKTTGLINKMHRPVDIIDACSDLQPGGKMLNIKSGHTNICEAAAPRQIAFSPLAALPKASGFRDRISKILASIQAPVMLRDIACDSFITGLTISCVKVLDGYLAKKERLAICLIILSLPSSKSMSRIVSQKLLCYP
jgi:hypothetical protein